MTQARPARLAGGIAAGWGVVLLGWAAYNCFWQVGFTTYAKGVFYYGGSSVNAETGSLNYAVLYLVSGVLLLRGQSWARGVVVGVALVEGYNRVRSLTGALLDEPQRRWFTSTAEGYLKLATFALGVVVTATLVIVLLRALQAREPAGWPAAAVQPSPFPSPFQPQPQLQPQPPAWQQPQPAWHAQPTQSAWHQPQPHQPQPQQQPPAAPPQDAVPPQPHPPTQQWAAGPVQPGPVPPAAPQPGPAAPPPAG